MIKKIKKAIEALKKINALEKKVRLLQGEVDLLMPENVPTTPEIKAQVNRFVADCNITLPVNFTISKNDLMFRYACYHIGNVPKAMYGYLQTGINPVNSIKKIVDAVYGADYKVESLLDFAAGYGRVTRFLVAEYGCDNVFVADIKTKAVDFVREQFGCEGWPSSFTPEAFTPNRKFNVIYVGSLFSHLPEELFKRWLVVLRNLLTENGILILSTHDISLVNSKNKNEYIFIEDSEDKMFTEVEDAIEEANNYGAAYIGEARVASLFSQCDIAEEHYVRFKRVLSNVQDVYVVAKNPIQMRFMPDLTPFP